MARDAVATGRGFGSPQAFSQKREVAHPALNPTSRKARDVGEPSTRSVSVRSCHLFKLRTEPSIVVDVEVDGISRDRTGRRSELHREGAAFTIIQRHRPVQAGTSHRR